MITINPLTLTSFSGLALSLGLITSAELERWSSILSSNFSTIATKWNHEVYPLLNSLPTQKEVDPFVLGLSGKTLFVDRLATGLYSTDSFLQRPQTIKEAQDESWIKVEKLRAILDQIELYLSRIAIVDPTYWTYIPTTPPSGISSSSVKALFRFDGSSSSLTDLSGNSNSLTYQAGFQGYAKQEDFVGLASGYYTSSPNSSLQILGEMTLELIICTSTYYNIWPRFIMEIYPTSYGRGLYAPITLILENTVPSGGSYYVFNRRFQHYITDSNRKHLYSFLVPGHIGYCAFVRDSAGEYTNYINGYLAATASVGLPLSGSTTYSLRLSPSDGYCGVFYSIRISNVAYGPSQILETYNYVKGLL